MAAVVAGTYAVIGVLLTKWLPEPKADANED
jgi:hypothetical protein